MQSEATATPGPIDMSLSKDSHAVQPRNIKFPSHIIGKQYRAFTSSLYDKYTWIEYSQCEDAIYCFHCRHFSKEPSHATFVTQGLRNWKKCYVYQIVDEVKAKLKRRFDDKNIAIMRGITPLCLSSSSFLDEDSLVAFAKLFNANSFILRCELSTFKHLLERKDKRERPGNLLEMQAYLQKLKEAFFELHRIVLIACTLPVSSAECERNFSSMRLIKIDLRTVMKQGRLDSLMMLGIDRDRAGKINLDTAVNRLKARFPRCRIAL